MALSSLQNPFLYINSSDSYKSSSRWANKGANCWDSLTKQTQLVNGRSGPRVHFWLLDQHPVTCHYPVTTSSGSQIRLCTPTASVFWKADGNSPLMVGCQGKWKLPRMYLNVQYYSELSHGSKPKEDSRALRNSFIPIWFNLPILINIVYNVNEKCNA